MHCHTVFWNLVQSKTPPLQAIVNCMAINEDGVVCTGADNGAMWAWDWCSGNAFQQTDSVAQPGSLEAEQGKHALPSLSFFLSAGAAAMSSSRPVCVAQPGAFEAEQGEHTLSCCLPYQGCGWWWWVGWGGRGWGWGGGEGGAHTFILSL